MEETILPKIAVLGGTGKEGTALALRWVKNGYRIFIGSRQLEKAQTVAASLNEQMGTDTIQGFANSDAVHRADICLLTVVQSAHKSALHSLKGDLHGKILIDTTARVDFRDPKPPAPPSAGRLAQEILGPGVRVVAAFQNTPAHALKKHLDQPLDFDVLVCSDDVDAAIQAVALVEGADMRGYYAGGLDNAIVVEGITSLLISMNKHYGGRSASVQITGVG